MKLKVFTPAADTSAEQDFPIREFEGEKGRQALKQVILAYMANRRQGTVSTKTRRTVHGTGKKPFRQKGTGMARQGSKVGPQHYHGAVAHGPQPRDWSQRINKKMRRLALQRALYERALDGEVLVIEQWQLDAPKTRLFNDLVGRLAPDVKSVMVVDTDWDGSHQRAGRNLARVQMGSAAEVNAYDLCRYDRLVFSNRALEHLLERANRNN